MALHTPKGLGPNLIDASAAFCETPQFAGYSWKTCATRLRAYLDAVLNLQGIDP